MDNLGRIINTGYMYINKGGTHHASNYPRNLRWGGKIKDATALPSDVAKGKVFYNNDGRQEGTLDLPFNIKTMMITGSGSSKTMSYKDQLEYNMYAGRPGSIQGRPCSYNTGGNWYYGKEIKGIKHIYAVKINGELFKVPSCGYQTQYEWGQDSSQVLASFYHYYDTLYVGSFSRVGECIIYYE